MDVDSVELSASRLQQDGILGDIDQLVLQRLTHTRFRPSVAIAALTTKTSSKETKFNYNNGNNAQTDKITAGVSV